MSLCSRRILSLQEMELNGRTADRRIVVGDVVDNDSWRLWPGGKRDQQMDKQIYREGGSLDEVLRNYRHVAVLTDSFS